MPDDKEVFAVTPAPPRRSGALNQWPTGGAADPVNAFVPGVEQEEDNLSLGRLWIVFRRNQWLVLGVTFATILGAAAYTYTAERIYRGSATLRIDSEDKGASILRSIAPTPSWGEEKLLTEMEVLRSRQLAENVARALNVNLAVTSPARSRRLLRPITVPESLSAGQFILSRNNGDSYSITVLGDSPWGVLPPTVDVGVPFSIGPAKLMVERPLGGRLPAQIRFEFRPFDRQVENMRRGLKVTQPTRNAEIVSVRYESADPELAAAVPNRLLDEFIRYKALNSRSAATSTVEFLRNQVSTYDAQLKRAEAELAAFSKREQVVSIGDEASAQVRRMADLQAERDQLLAESRALAPILGRTPAPGESSARDIASFPSFIANRAMQDLLSSLTQLETQRNQLLVRRNPKNDEVVALTSRIDDLNNQLSQMARGYAAGVNSKLGSVNATIESFGRRIETIPAREVAYARLSRDRKLLEDISTLLQTRLKEAEITEAVRPGDVQVIDRARVPARPSSPDPATNLFLGLIVGLMLGSAAAALREVLDTKVRTKEDLQTLARGLPILASIPYLGASHSGLAGVLGRSSSNGSSREEPGTSVITRTQSLDMRTESYRALRTNITFAGADHPHQVLVLTSALPGDGKSTTAANLGVSLAQQGVRTLLIDADLRRGNLHSLFRIRREPGFTQVLIGKTTLGEAIQIVPVGGHGLPLRVLASGHLPPNPAELLGSQRMRVLLEELRQQFDMILFDTPPLNVATDAAILGTLADSTIFVVRAGKTEKRGVQNALAQLQHLKVHVSGTIINDFDPKQGGYGYEYGYGYAARQSGDVQSARNWYSRALDLDSQDAEVAAYLAELTEPLMSRTDESQTKMPVSETADTQEETRPPEAALHSSPIELVDADASAFDTASRVRDVEATETRTSEGEGSPIITRTLAELDLQQGHVDAALEIYRQLALREPDDPSIRGRIDELARDLEVHQPASVESVSGEVEAALETAPAGSDELDGGEGPSQVDPEEVPQAEHGELSQGEPKALNKAQPEALNQDIDRAEQGDERLAPDELELTTAQDQARHEDEAGPPSGADEERAVEEPATPRPDIGRPADKKHSSEVDRSSEVWDTDDFWGTGAFAETEETDQIFGVSYESDMNLQERSTSGEHPAEPEREASLFDASDSTERQGEDVGSAMREEATDEAATDGATPAVTAAAANGERPVASDRSEAEAGRPPSPPDAEPEPVPSEQEPQTTGDAEAQADGFAEPQAPTDAKPLAQVGAERRAQVAAERQAQVAAELAQVAAEPAPSRAAVEPAESVVGPQSFAAKEAEPVTEPSEGGSEVEADLPTTQAVEPLIREDKSSKTAERAASSTRITVREFFTTLGSARPPSVDAGREETPQPEMVPETPDVPAPATPEIPVPLEPEPEPKPEERHTSADDAFSRLFADSPVSPEDSAGYKDVVST